MNKAELRQAIIDAMKSVAWCDDHDKRLDAIEPETDNLMDLIDEYAQQGRNGGQ